MFLPSPALIDSLDRRFGSVWISHDGDQINVACPLCPKRNKGTDNSGHMGLNFAKGVFHCVRCDAGGSLKKFLERNQLQSAAAQVAIHSISEWKDLMQGLKTGKMREVRYAPPSFDRSKFPGNRRVQLKDYTSNTVFGNSLKSKNISLEEAERHFLCVSEHGRAAGYVIFPFFEEYGESPCYWQGRDATGEAYLRKLNPSNEECPQGKAHWLYNFEAVERGGVFYVVEGALDAITLQSWLLKNKGEGHTALSVQGTALSFPSTDTHPLNTQYGKIAALAPSEVVVVFDADAWEKSKELAKVLCVCGLNARPIQLYGGDPNELGDEIGRFINSKVSSLTERLKRASF